MLEVTRRARPRKAAFNGAWRRRTSEPTIPTDERADEQRRT